jgi:hypothetical protein
MKYKERQNTQRKKEQQMAENTYTSLRLSK